MFGLKESCSEYFYGVIREILTWASEVASAFGVRVPIARDFQIVFVVPFVGVREAVYEFLVDVFGF